MRTSTAILCCEVNRRSLSGVRFLCGAVVAVLLMSLVGCAPRGETKTLDEVFQIAKKRYEESIVKSDASGAVQEQLLQLAADLNQFAAAEGKDGSREQLAPQISEQMATLLQSAGYTTRPAFGALLKSYRTPPKTQRARRLLVARSYTALAQELETTSFLVKKAGV
ncbi:hypothetical protein MRY87_04030 [bacterium]|nr:hypothetical protein [bacterium]